MNCTDPRTLALAAVESARRALDAAVVALSEPVTLDDGWLDLESAAKQYPVAAETLRDWCRRGRLQCCTAERGRIVFRRSWLDAAIQSRPYTPRAQRDAANDGEELDALNEELASGRLVASK